MLEGLLARARARVSPPSGRVAHRAPDPLDPKLGPGAFRLAGAGPMAADVTGRWDEDPATDEPLPRGSDLQLAPDAFRDARIAHRHGWLPALAFAGARGDAAATDRALTLLDGWLRQDIPGTGLAWAHGSDLAVRLAHWHAGLSWLGGAAPEPLRALLAGSAAWHLEHLRDRMPQEPGPRRIAHLCGLVIGGLTFPGVPDARGYWSTGLAGLRAALPLEVHGDGAAKDDAPLCLAETLWWTAIARAVARADGVGFPGAADAAFARGARYLERLAGEIGGLPLLGDAPLGDLLAADTPIAWSLWNLALAWGLERGAPAPGAATDPRLAWLLGPHAGAELAVEPTEAAGKTWSMWVFRESGVVAAWQRVKGAPSRVVAEMGMPERMSPDTHVAPLQVLWDVGDVAVLADPGPAAGAGRLAAWLASPAAHNGLVLDGHRFADAVPAELGVARVDGKKARIEARHAGWRRFRVPVVHERDVLLNQARLVVTDRLVPTGRQVGRHAVRLSWQLGPGWSLTPEPGGYVAKNGSLTLVIRLPSELAWSVIEGDPSLPAGWTRSLSGPPVPAPCLVGDGGVDGEATFVSSFEVR